jgi:hypothetical protein
MHSPHGLKALSREWRLDEVTLRAAAKRLFRDHDREGDTR